METERRSTSSTGGEKGVKIARFDLVPLGPLTALAKHYGRGAQKYDSHQWRRGYEWSKSYAALLRHLFAFWSGDDFDSCPPDGAGCSEVDASGAEYARREVDGRPACFNHTGSHHLDAVMWHSFALREFVDRFPEHDDRYQAARAAEPPATRAALNEIPGAMMLRSQGISAPPFLRDPEPRR